MERLNQILVECIYNAHFISEQVVTLNVARSNQETLEYYRRKVAREESSGQVDNREPLTLACSSQDIIFQLLHIGLCFFGRSEVKTRISELVVQIIGHICQGRRFLRCHLELVFQHVKCSVFHTKKRALQSDLEQEDSAGFKQMDYSLRLLHAIVTKRREIGPRDYFYFSGYLSGILLNSKNKPWPFAKSFSVCLWFQICDRQNELQDPHNLPVLFNCSSNGSGGFECYLNGNKLFYRILPPNNNFPPKVDSNGILITELTPNKWYFLGLEHEKPYLARAHLTAFINDKQIVNFPMDYPRFDANAKLSMVSICTNMVGQLTSFILFKEQIGNPQKFVQIYNAIPHGLEERSETNSGQSTAKMELPSSVFDSSLLKKILLMFSPQRTHNKLVYDYFDMNDAELLFNCGTWYDGQAPLLADTTGILSLIPILEQIKTIIALQSRYDLQQQKIHQEKKSQKQTKRVERSDREDNYQKSADLVNQWLKLAISAFGNMPFIDQSAHKALQSFIKLLMQAISTMPVVNRHVLAVDCQTIQLLAEMRFSINDQLLSEEFFLNLMKTADFWVSTHNMDIINEFWSFVKTIYSQNPIAYNKVFPLSKLIDFMLKLCDLTKIGASCCEYSCPECSQNVPAPANNNISSISDSQNRNPDDSVMIEKYLEPISGVLEYVLTNGGYEILGQIEFIARSLIAKSCASFHLQMLKLLKVLLIDSRSDLDCASPIDFATSFLNSNGLQILLYLCQNASYDVKAMCIKLIDVLSSHTQLIQMRIDTDLITYLSHVILPEQIVALHHGKKLEFAHHKMDLTRNETMNGGELIQDDQRGNQQELQLDSIQEHHSSSNQRFNFFAFKEVDGAESSEASVEGQSNELENCSEKLSRCDSIPLKKRDSYDTNSDHFEDPKLMAPKVTRSNKKPLKNAENSDNHSEKRLETTESKTAADQNSKKVSSSYRSAIQFEDERNSPNIKPQKGRDMFSFQIDTTTEKEDKMSSFQLPSSSNVDSVDDGEPDDEADEITKPWQKKKKNLNLEDFDSGDDFVVPAPKKQWNPPRGPSGQNKNNFGMNLNVEIDDDFTDLMPPTRAQHEQRFGDAILGHAIGEESPKEANKKDEEPPKPTADVIMSRRLRGGVKGGFDFDFLSDENDSQNGEEEADKNSKSDSDNSQQRNHENVQNKLVEPAEPQRKTFNLLQQQSQQNWRKGGGVSGISGPKSVSGRSNKSTLLTKASSLPPLLVTEAMEVDQSNDRPDMNDKEVLQQAQPRDVPKEKKPSKAPRLVLAIESSDEKKSEQEESDSKSNNSDNDHDFESNSPNDENPDDQLAGATGATKELTLDAFSNSSNERGVSNTQQQQLSLNGTRYRNEQTKKSRGMNLLIDTESINKQFNFGGEKGEMKEEIANENLENDIIELAQKCIEAMQKSKKSKPKSNFQRLLEEAVADQEELEDDEDLDKSGSEVEINSDEQNQDEDIDGEIENIQDSEEKAQTDQAAVFKPKGGRAGDNRGIKSMFNVPLSVRGIKQIKIDDDIKKQQAARNSNDPNSSGGDHQDGQNKRNFKLTLTNIFEQATITESLQESNQSTNGQNVIDEHSGSLQSDLMLSSGAGRERGSSNVDQLGSHLNQKEIQANATQQIVSSAVMNQLDDGDLNPMLRSGDAERYLISRSTGRLDGAGLEQDIAGDQIVQVSKKQETLSMDQQTRELENLYTSCLEWLLSRAPSSLFKNAMIDDYDKITFQPALQVIMTLVSYAKNLVRQRALQDLHMLAQLDSQNGQLILQHPKFHQWLLELLMPYQDFAANLSALSESSRAVYDMGVKLHTLLLKNAFLSQDHDAPKRINLLTRWPAVILESSIAKQVQQQDQFGENGEKLPNSARKDQIDIMREVEVANSLTRTMLKQLLYTLKIEVRNEAKSFNLRSAFVKNMAHLTIQIEELILSSHDKDLGINSQDSLDASITGPTDINESLLRWVTKDFLLYHGTNVNQKQRPSNLWAEWNLIENLVPLLITLFTNRPQMPSSTMQNQSYQHSLNTDSDIDLLAQVEILLFGHQSSSNSQSVSGLPQQSSRFSVLNILQGNSASNEMSSQGSTPSSQFNSSLGEQSLIKSLINIVCIAIEQSETKNLTFEWLARLEVLVKHILIVAELWKPKHFDAYYGKVQRQFAEIAMFALTFLFHETNNSSTPKAKNLSANSQAASPYERVERGKQFSQTMKNILIFIASLTNYEENADFDQTSQQKKKDFMSASEIILTQLLVKEFSGGKKSQSTECLLSKQDLIYHRESNFEEFPERFHQNDWKMAFFHNKTIQGITRRQINLKTLEQFEGRRKAYAKQICDTVNSNNKARDEILQTISEETLNTIVQISDSEAERKTREALLVDSNIREQLTVQKKILKDQFGVRGPWRSRGDRHFGRVLLQDTGEGAHCLLVDRPTNTFVKMASDDESLNKLIFSKQYKNSAANIDLIIAEQCQLDSIYANRKDFYTPASKIEIVQERKGKSNNMASKNKEDQFSDDEEEISVNGNEQQDKGTSAKVDQNDIWPWRIELFNKRLSQSEKRDLKENQMKILRDHFIETKSPKRKLVAETPIQILHPLENRKGTLIMTNYELLFIYQINTLEEPETRPKSTIFFFEWEIPEHKSFFKTINLSAIREIQKRLFLSQKTALEIFFMNNTQLLLNFPDNETREHFARKIVRQRKSKCKNLKYYHSLDPKNILKQKRLTEDWQNWRISNFEYLMQLNMLAGRSYNDLSQYPVMPWLLSTYSVKDLPDLQAINAVPRGGAPPGQFRDLTKNMQLLGSATRQAEFRKKYDDAESFIGLNDRFHCGSHFSNPGIVLHYLSRLSPYLDANVELHGKSLDHPERTFFALNQSFYNALNDFTDVRELTPEFYFLPEMFINHNYCNFGRKQDGKVVSDVLLPPWADQNPFKFVQVQREGIESQYVSANLHTWIDFIFGAKQRGQEAINSLNTFSKITYAPREEGDFDISKEKDPILKAAYESQCYNYGQTPAQLTFSEKRHPARKSQMEALGSHLVVDIVARLKVFKPVPDQQSQNPRQKVAVTINKEAILAARFVGEQKIVGATKGCFIQHFVWLPKSHIPNQSTPFSLGGDKKTRYNPQIVSGGVDQIDRSIKKYDQPIVILGEGRYVVRGGFWDGKLAFCPVEGSQDPELSLHGHRSTVSAIALDETEQIMITGTKTGDVIIWKNSLFESSFDESDPNSPNGNQADKSQGSSSINANGCSWFLYKRLLDHDRQVSSIFISRSMCLFVTGSFDGTANLYNLQTGKLIRTFVHPSLAPIYSVLLAQNPLAICAFYSREDHLWNSFSINGKLLTDLSRLGNAAERTRNQRVLTEDCSHVISPLVIKDSYHMDKLVYGTEKGYIVLRMLPSMLRFRRLQVSSDYPVLALLVSPDRRFLHVSCGDGGLIVIQAK